jgi:hypothetical protein
VKPDPYTWLPFGGGIRRCIGMAFAQVEMRLVIATIVKQARLKLVGAPAKVTRRGITLARGRDARGARAAHATTDLGGVTLPILAHLCRAYRR